MEASKIGDTGYTDHTYERAYNHVNVRFKITAGDDFDKTVDYQGAIRFKIQKSPGNGTGASQDGYHVAFGVRNGIVYDTDFDNPNDALPGAFDGGGNTPLGFMCDAVYADTWTFASDGILYDGLTPSANIIGTASSGGACVIFNGVGIPITDPDPVLPDLTCLIEATVHLTAKTNCDCPSGVACTPGAISPELNSVDWKAVVGNGDFGDSQNVINFSSGLPSAAMTLPTSLTVHKSSDATLISYPSGAPYYSAPHQLLTAQALASIDVTDSYTFSINYYLSSQAGTFNSSLGYYDSPTASPYKTITVQNPDGSSSTTRLKITETQGSATTVTMYTWDPVNNLWTMSGFNGLQKETLSRTWNGDKSVRTEVKTVYTPGSPDVAVYKVQKQYTVFPWGEELTQQVIDPDGAKLTNVWVYNTDATDTTGQYSHLILMTNYTGYWEQYAYDTSFRIKEVDSPFMNSPFGSAASSCRSVTTTYSTSVPQETIKTFVLGNEVARRYRVYYTDVVEDIVCQTAGTSASYTANDNLVTITTNYPSGDTFAGFVKSMVYPDQTMAFYSYSLGSGQRTTTVYRGQPNSGKSAIAEGTKTVTVTDLAGKMVSKTVYNVTGSADGVTLSSEGYSYASGDNFKTSPTITYLDGTELQINSDCCTITSMVNRDGATTEYLYDDRLRRFGQTLSDFSISTTNLLDGAGNVLRTVRVGSDGTTNRLYAALYDLAGRVVRDTNALDGTTTYTNVPGLGTGMMSTNVYPDGGTRIYAYFLDGRTASVAGTAVAPMQYVYGVEQDGSGGPWREFTLAIKLTATGGTNEWTKTYTDCVGRSYKTIFAAPPGSTQPSSISYFNNLGQRTNDVDPDGVSMIYGYNLKGEPIYSILNSNRTSIDFTSLGSQNRVTSVIADVTANGSDNVLRSTTSKWLTSATSGTTVSVNETSVNGLKSWRTLYNNGGASSVTGTGIRVYGSGGYRYETNTAPDGSFTVSRFQYGRLQSVVRTNSDLTTQLGQITYGYDAHGRLLTVSDLGSGTVTNYYSLLDQVNGVGAPLSQVSSNYFDNLGRLIRATLPDGTSQTNEFYPTGLIKRTYGSRTYPVGYGYDSQGRMTTMTNWSSFAFNAGTRVTTWNYNAYRGYLDSKTYDGGAAGPSYQYTDAGRLYKRIWARGTNTTYSYNNAGDLAGVTYSDSTKPVTYDYDRLGQPITITTDPSGSPVVCSRTYNDQSEPLVERYTGGPLDGLSVSNIYNGLLLRTNLSIGNASAQAIYLVTNGYDGASRLTMVSDNTNSAVYSYLANSPLVSQITFAHGGTTTMTTTKSYDALNRLTSISSANASSVVLDSHGYGYNSANQRTTVTNADGTYWLYQYDSLGQVTSGRKYWSDGSVIPGQQFGYAFDEIGNRTSTQAGGNEFGANLRSASYTANSKNQYTSRTVPNAVDIIGSATNLATVTVNNHPSYRHNDYYRVELPIDNSGGAVWQSVSNLAVLQQGTSADIISSFVGNVYVPPAGEYFYYDADGNLTADGRWTYAWDAENRLVNMTSQSFCPAGSKLKLDFAYDYMGRRIQKTVSTYNTSTSNYIQASQNIFVYDAWNLIDILNSAFTPLTSFLWGLDVSGSKRDAGGVGGLLGTTQYAPSNTQQFVCYDGNENITALVDASSSAVTGQYEYEPFGENMRLTGPAAKANPFRFATKFQDDETDCLYYGYRYYNADLGKWLSRDPIDEEGGLNLYGFLANDSLNNVDNLGMMTWNDVMAEVKRLNNLKIPCCACKSKAISKVSELIKGTSPNVAVDGTSVDISSKLEVLGCVDTIEYWWWDCFSAQDEARGLFGLPSNWHDYGWSQGSSSYSKSHRGHLSSAFDAVHWDFAGAIVYTYCGSDGFDRAKFTISNELEYTWKVAKRGTHTYEYWSGPVSRDEF